MTQGLINIFKLDMDQFMVNSPIPLAVRMRLELGKLGMKFEDDGKPALITNENPIPLGTAWWWEEVDNPSVRVFAQRIEEGKS